MNEKKHNGLRRWGRRILWVIAVILIMVMVLRLSLKMGFVHSWVKDYLVTTANQQLNAELSISQLSGDLWEEVEIYDLRLIQDNTTVFHVDSVHASYDILAVLGGRIAVSDLIVYQPNANLRQERSRWNVQDILPESSDTTSGMPSVGIENFELREGAISVQSDSMPVESHFTIDQMMLSSSLQYRDEEYDLNLKDLSFQLQNTQLDQPLKVQTSASAQNDKITLERLVLATGSSIIQSSGYANPPDSSVQISLSASPVSWQDIASFARDFPLREDVQMDLALSGTPEQFEVSLAMESKAMQSFKINSRFQFGTSLVLQDIQVSGQSLQLSELFSDTTLPNLQELNAAFSGYIDLADYQQGQGDLEFSAENISRGPIRVDQVTGEGSLNNHEAEIDIEARTPDQRLSVEMQVKQLWDDLPFIQSKINATNIDPAYWMQDSSYAGRITLQSEVSGRGWYPQEDPWQYSLEFGESRFMGRSIADFAASGEVAGDGGNLEAQLNIREGIIRVIAELHDMDQSPGYSYQIDAQNLDAGGIMGRDDFKTALNGKITGTGRGFDPASMQQKTSVKLDSSIVNKELLQNFTADLTIGDSVAVVDTARLQSAIAEGSFSLRMNLLNRYDPDNELSVNLLLKELDTLAPLADVEDLEAEGTVNGILKPLGNEYLQFQGNVDLSAIKYNQLFATERAEGFLDIKMQKEILYAADLDLTKPAFSGIQLQDLSLVTEGMYADSTADGQYKFQFSSSSEGRIEQAGSYSLAKDSISVQTNELNFISDYRTLTLEKPFELSIQNDSLRMDTMRISSGSEAFLEVGIPLATAEQQQGYVHGKSLNTSVIQNSLLGKTFVGGLLSGRLEFSRQDTNLDARAEMLLSEITYHESNFDSLRINGQVANERVEGVLSATHDGTQLITGNANLPFKLGDPEEFPDAFFEEPVSGTFRINDLAIEQFDSLFAEIGLTETSGIFSFQGNLEGSAGEPDFTADAKLRKANLSGVYVDSVTAGANYSHDDAELVLDASVTSLQQQVAQISAQLPLFVDMKTLYAELPQSQDSITVDIETNRFDLKALNDFLDPKTYREVAGRLDGMVRVQGKIENLKTEGQLTLDDGAFRFIPAGIKVDNIESTVDFFSNQIRLTDFSAESGKGDLRAQGVMAVEKLVPGGFDISIEAQNFRAANTTQYNAVVNLDAAAEGTFTQPKITGSLDFVSGFVELQNFGEKSVEKIELDTLEENGPDISYYDSLALDMDINLDRRFYVRNQRYLDLEVELDGTLDLVKGQGQDLELFGSMNAPNGYARPFGKQFDLQEGALTFSGDPANPQLMIRTRFQPPQAQENVVIWYIIEGTVEDPQFKYESEPPMELENIISYTLFGQPFYALDSWEQVVASSGSNTTAADVALDVLLDRVEALATQKLGIDVVRIDNARVGGETGTSVTTGWYLNPKVFFAIQNVISGSAPDTGFLLEYMLREDLKLIIRQGQGIRQGMDLRWNYDY